MQRSNQRVAGADSSSEDAFAAAFAGVGVGVGVPDDIMLEDQDVEEVVTRRNEQEPDLTLDNIRDHIVAHATFRSYIGDLAHFLKWVMQNKRMWLTDYGITHLADIETRRETETA